MKAFYFQYFAGEMNLEKAKITAMSKDSREERDGLSGPILSDLGCNNLFE